MTIKNILLAIFISVSGCPFFLHGRSIHRKIDPSVPRLTTQWQGSKRTYIRIDSHYEEYPIFSCQSYLTDMMENHLLSPYITIDTPTQVISGNILNTLLEELVTEVQKKKAPF